MTKTVHQASAGAISAASVAPTAVFQAESIAFWNAHHGLVAGTFVCSTCARRLTGAVMETRDGGSTWDPVITRGGLATEVVTLPGGDALVRIGPRLLHLADRGRSWTSLGRSQVRGMTFVDPRIGWAVRTSLLTGPLVTTTDGGVHWHRVHDPCGPLAHFLGPAGMTSTTVGYIADVWFASAQRGWVLCGGDGAGGSAPVAVFRTIDGGSTWAKQEASWDAEPGGLQFLRDGRGWRWSYDFSEVLLSSDGGDTWRRGGSFGVGSGIRNSICFVSADVGFALGDGELFGTHDGGRTWRRIAKITPVQNTRSN